MKKLILLLALCLLLTGCGGEEAAVPSVPILGGSAAETVTYTVTVLNGAGNPVPKAMVQLCQDTCYPGIADDDGIVTFQVPEGDYKVAILSLPEGFSGGYEEEYTFQPGSFELTIRLTGE